MRTTVLILAAVGAAVAVLSAGPPAAEARTWYPFCATYADSSGITKCSFSTVEQCQATVSGIGGFCKSNQLPPPAAGVRPVAVPKAVRQVPAPVPTGLPARRWHPFCATYADAFGATRCSFDTYQECQDTLGGNGGFCTANAFLPDGSRNVVR